MHKARENNDGSFSIGKTWMLDDLSGIQSYSAFVPKTPVEQQQKEWASNVGFVVTVGKPYYWHARSPKEKEFFIGSLVKIYKKYTGGKAPELVGFDERERALLVGTGPSAPSAPAPPASQGAGLGPPPELTAPTTSAYSSREPSRDGPREIRRKPSEDPALRTQKSREQLRPTTASKPAPSPFSTSPNPPSNISAAQRVEPKGKEPPSTSLNTTDENAAITAQPSEPRVLGSKRSTDGQRPTTPGSFGGETRGVTASLGSSVGPSSPYREGVEKIATLDQPPRPSPDKGATDDLPPVAAPDEPKPTSPPEADVPSSSIAVEPAVAATVEAAEKPSKPTAETPTEKPPVVPQESTEEKFDLHRPGLGPMVKKKSNKDIAGAFRKAANAYGAFKPRVGGAGERLLAAAKKQQAEEIGPDGITGVVPAPSLTRSANEPPVDDETPAKEPPTTIPAAGPPPSIPPPAVPPMVEISQHAIEEAPVAPILPPAKSKDSLADIGRVEDRSRTPSPAAQGRRRKRREDHTIQYCQALGIDPSVLDGRGIEFDGILTDLGWDGRLGDEQKIEDLEADIRREIGRVEATSWLGNLVQQEGKVEQLAVLIDKTIEECEELDGLLTLYSHELNVSHGINAVFVFQFADCLYYPRLFMRMSPTSKRSPKACKCRPRTRSFFRTSSRTF